MTESHSTTTALVIADVEILQDIHGRYSLNTLHRASGASENKRPSKWSELIGTKELIAELNSQSQDSCFDVVKGGNAPGTYAHELLAVSYAGWISPAFQLRVNQIFLDRKHHVTPVLASDRYPELRAMKELIEGIAEARTVAEQAERKADLALAQQLWLTIEEYVYLHGLRAQFPPSEWAAFGHYLGGYCQEHGIPIRKQPVAGKPYNAANAYHVEIMHTLIGPWLGRRGSQGQMGSLN